MRLVTKVLRLSLPGPGKLETLLSRCSPVKFLWWFASSPRAQYRRFILNMTLLAGAASIWRRVIANLIVFRPDVRRLLAPDMPLRRNLWTLV